MPRPETRIGISGWRYPRWRGTFYPSDLVQRRELEFASREFNSIEINGSFYSLQPPTNWERWYRETPEGFVFSVKGPRFITHMKKLRDVEAPLANFFASGVLALREKLGPVLWQFPPNFPYNPDRLETFLKMLPRNHAAAEELTSRCDEKISGKRWRGTSAGSVLLRHCVEVRHDSYAQPAFVEQLRRHEVGLVLADTAGRWFYSEDITADFVYIRLHGAEELYVSGYTDAALDWWTDRIFRWQCGSAPTDSPLLAPVAGERRKTRNVFVYFDNDAKVHAPFDARRLTERLKKLPSR